MPGDGRPADRHHVARADRYDDHSQPLGHAAEQTSAPPLVAVGDRRWHRIGTMLSSRGLTKRYGGLLALDRVSFELRPGEIVGYLGPNGSGKSTTVNLVVGLLEPSAGDISLCGIRASEDPIAYKRRIGYVPEELSLHRRRHAPLVPLM